MLPMPLPVSVATALRHPKLDFLWMEITDTATLPKPVALRAVFQHEGPFPDRLEDTTWHRNEPLPTVENAQILLKFGTINVLTLESGPKNAQTKGLMQLGRISAIQSQLTAKGIHIVGLQECRTQQALTRHSGTHLVYQSGAANAGTHGVELWLDRQVPYAVTKNTKFFFQADHIHVAYVDPRCLYAVLKAPHLHLRILVLHAPHQTSQDIDYQTWWNNVSRIVHKTATGVPLVVLADTNSQIGNIPSDSISTHHASTESPTGHSFHAFLMEHGLWVPSSFEECHRGESYTFIASEGTRHRLDFICLPLAWHSFQVHSEVCYDLDFATAKHDHFLAQVTVQMLAQNSQDHRVHRCRIDVRKCADPRLREQFEQYMCHPPQIPWGIGVGQHAEILTAWLQNGAQTCFKVDKTLPRQRYMSANTWAIVQVRKQLHILSRHSSLMSNRMTVCCIFRLWHASTSSHASQHDLPCRNMYETMQSKCDHMQWWAITNRRRLHGLARLSSRQDRIQSAQQIAENFIDAAQHGHTQTMYRALKPLLGQQHRKNKTHFRPVPAVKMEDGTLACTMQDAHNRWQQHFAEPEDGISVSTTQMQVLANLQAPRCNPEILPFHLPALPTADEVINFIQKARKGKAPGLDGLPAELYQLDTVAFAHVYLPLLMKCAIRCTEPLRWKGGAVCALPKAHHASMDPNQFRSILLADFSSKLFHGILRQKLLPMFDMYRLSTQAGGVPGLSTDFLTLYIQAFSRMCSDHGNSSALLFVDVRQAFYRACRPFVVDRSYMPESAIVNLFRHCGWTSSFYQDFRQHVFEQSALGQAKVAPHLESQVNAVLSGTWFQLRNVPQSLVSTNTGTRPGDSLADLLYGFLMGKFLHLLRTRFQGHGLSRPLPLRWHPCADIDPNELDPVELFHACWVDDLVLLLDSSNCQVMIAKVQKAMALIQDCAAEFGLMLNYSRQKTSVLLTLRGQQAQQTWKTLLSPDPLHPSIAFDCLSLDFPGNVAVVPDYVYLGTLVDGSGHPAVEVKRRFLSLQAPKKLLHKGIFRSPRLPQHTRLLLFQSLLMSKLTYGCGAWQYMHIQTQRSWHSQLMKLYASIAPVMKRAEGVSTLDILADIGVAPPILVLMCHRFRLFGRLLQVELHEILAVLQAQQPETSWLQLLCQDVTRIASLVTRPDLHRPGDSPDIQSLASLAFQQPRYFAKLSKKVVEIYQGYLKLWKDYRRFQADFDREAQSHGVDWTERETPQHVEGSFVCDHCAAVFDSFHGLCTHTWKLHNIHNVAQQYAITPTCRACLKCYDGRSQLLQHLKYFRTGCLLKLIATVPPLTEAELAEIHDTEREQQRITRKAQRKSRHRQPVIRLAGPIRPWPWQRSVQFVKHDRRSFSIQITATVKAWISRILEMIPDSSVCELLHVLQELPCHGKLLQVLTDSFVAFYHPEESTLTMEWYLLLQEALQLWQSNAMMPPMTQCIPIKWSICQLSLTQVRIPAVAEKDHVPTQPERRADFMAEQWNATDVTAQLRLQLHKQYQRQYRFPAPQAPPMLTDPIYLYVFSGRRRQGDYEHFIMQMLPQHHMRGRVLLLDLALSPAHDVTNTHLVEQLLTWFTQGAIAGMLIAPPCETWSEIRWEPTDDPNAPRPLRDAQDPMCKQALTSRELSQLEVSNFLLFVALRLMLAAICTSTPAIMEHPKRPRKKDRASIWALPWMQHFLASGFVTLELVWQATFGAPSPKPTHLAVCHAPKFKQIMRQHQLPTDWSKLVTLKGKQPDGSWATSAAKEYPPRMNEALAAVHVITCHDKLQAINARSCPDVQIDAVFRSLYAGDQPFEDQHVNPDYHGPKKFHPF